MKAYEKMGFGENLGWCRPYASEDERVYAVFCEGEIISLMIDGVEHHKGFFGEVDLLPKIAEAARIVNEYSDMYTDILDAFWDGAMHEVGCEDCPWRDECVCMDLDEEEEAIYRIEKRLVLCGEAMETRWVIYDMRDNITLSGCYETYEQAEEALQKIIKCQDDEE